MRLQCCMDHRSSSVAGRMHTMMALRSYSILPWKYKSEIRDRPSRLFGRRRRLACDAARGVSGDAMKARGCRASESGAVITLKPRARCSGAVHGRAAALGDKGGIAIA